ncbi:MAG TPA: hypothetical protein VD996_02630 [Chitinophagaceae bacterium]|nr:hypothetical protein [Chitinophagaceae bacterium]
MNKSSQKAFRGAASQLISEGAPINEKYSYSTGGQVFYEQRPVNHYRRIKRLAKRLRLAPNDAIVVYAKTVK